MALKVSSWVLSTKDELVPVCQPNHALNLTIRDEKYEKLTFSDDLCLDSCWEYFKRGAECFIVEPQFDSAIENYIYNLFNFKFSFRELKNLKEEKTFSLKKNKVSLIYLHEIKYISDKIFHISVIKGFALLKITELQILTYYDFEKEFTSDIKIPLRCQFTCFVDREVKLIHRSIWIVRELNVDTEYGNDYLI